MKNDRDTEQALKSLRWKVTPEADARTLGDSLAAFDEASSEQMAGDRFMIETPQSDATLDNASPVQSRRPWPASPLRLSA